MRPTVSPVDHLTRRRLLTGAGVLGVLTVLPGCGQGEDVTAPSSGPATSVFPVTVEHDFGRAVITAEPGRVVAIGYTYADFVLAFGMVPFTGGSAHGRP